MNEAQQTVRTLVEELGACLGRVDPAELDRLVSLIDASPRVFCAGAGRSALGVRGFAMRLMHLGKTVYVVGETTTPGIARGDLLVIGSGSGRTASLLAAATKATSVGANVALVTIDPGSPIGQLARVTVKVPAPSPKAASGGGDAATIQPMGSLFEQCLFILLDAVVVLLMKRTGMTSDQMFARHANLE